MTPTVTDSSPQQDLQTTPAADSSRGGEPRDAELLRRFVRLKDEAAFAALVERHSRLVIGVCRRVLRSEHDIEDAFQATFLVLARDAARIRKKESLASWLHGVAYRTSLRAVSSSHRRHRLLRDVTMTHDQLENSNTGSPFAELEDRDQRQALDEELAALPDNYRAPLVLHYLEGKSNQQVAEDLDLSVTAVEGRLKRGKKELRLRLARRGVGLSVAVTAMQMASSAASAAPIEPLIVRTIDAGLSFAGGEAAGPVYTPEAARLAGQEIAAMSTTSVVTLATILLVPLALGFSGHDPHAAGDSGPVVVSTLVAQAGSDGGGEEAGISSTVTHSNTEEKNSGSTESESGVAPDDEARIRAALDVPTEVEFIDTPFNDAVRDLAVGHNITILVDGVALKERGIESDQPINLSMSGHNLRTVLKIMLEPLGLATLAEDGVLKILSIEEVADKKRFAQALAAEAESSFAADARGLLGIGAYGGMFGAGGGEAGTEDSGRSQKRQSRPLSPASDVLGYKPQSQNAMRIQEAMESPTVVEFVDTPLHDAMNYLAQLHNITILIDRKAFQEDGIGDDEPINLVLRDLQLRSVLNLMLRNLGLTTIIRDEVLTVTTKSAAAEILETRVYNIRQLGDIEPEKLVEILEQSIQVDWLNQTGMGGTAIPIDGALVVTQAPFVHEKVADLLNQLYRHQAMGGAATSDARNPAPNTYHPSPRKPSPPENSGKSIGNQSSHSDWPVPTNWPAPTRATQTSIIQMREGRVRDIKQDATGATEYVEISVGSEVGLQKGHEVYVIRSSDDPALLQYVAKIRILMVTEDHAVGHVVESAGNETIQKGDGITRVAPRSGRDFGFDPQHESASGDGQVPEIWKPFASETLQRMIEAGDPVVVNFTADWCLVCRSNEAMALYTRETSDFLKQHHVNALRADYTQPDDEIKTWLEKLGSVSVPLTVVFPKRNSDRPVILEGPITQSALLKALDEAVTGGKVSNLGSTTLGGLSGRNATFSQPNPPDKPVRAISFNFNQAPWKDVLDLYADATGRAIDLLDLPPGTFSYADSRAYDAEESLTLLNDFLNARGYELVAQSGGLRCQKR